MEYLTDGFHVRGLAPVTFAHVERHYGVNQLSFLDLAAIGVPRQGRGALPLRAWDNK